MAGFEKGPEPQESLHAQGLLKQEKRSTRDAGGQGHWVLHQLLGDWAHELGGWQAAPAPKPAGQSACKARHASSATISEGPLHWQWSTHHPSMQNNCRADLARTAGRPRPPALSPPCSCSRLHSKLDSLYVATVRCFRPRLAIIY